MKNLLLLFTVLLVFDSCNGQGKEYKTFSESGNIEIKGQLGNDETPIGTWIIYYENGQIEETGKYVEGLKNGEWKEFYRSGEIEGIGNYEGNKIGEWKYYYQNGNLRSVGSFKEGIPIGEWKYYYENKQLWKTGKNNKNGNIGKWEYYHENGKLALIGQYNENAVITGEWKEFDINGSLVKIVNY